MTARSALIVATDSYDDPKLTKLNSPTHDVEALRSVLTDPKIGNFNVQVLFNSEAHIINRSIESFFIDRKVDDLLLLYFSCHGVKDRSGRLYLTAKNTDIDLLGSTGVSSQFVNEQMERSRSRRIALMLDCCYSGAFTRGFAVRSGTETGVDDQLSGEGRVIITASDSLQYAFEGDAVTGMKGQPALFTGAVVEGLKTGHADKKNTGRVSANDLYDYVYNDVRERNPNQTPRMESTVQGRLYLAANPNSSKRPLDNPGDPLLDSSSGVSWEREEAALGLKGLTEAPDAAIAQAATEALKKLTADRDRLVRATALAAQDDVLRSHFERALVMSSYDATENAIAEFAKVLELEGSSAASSTSKDLRSAAEFNTAVLLMRSGRREDAREMYLRVAHSGDSRLAARAWLNLGCDSEESGNMSAAVQEYDRASDSSDEKVRSRASFLLARLEEKNEDYEKAFRHFYAASADESQDVATVALQAQARLQSLVSPGTVVEVLMDTSRLRDVSASAWLVLAEVYASEGLRDQANRACDRAETLDHALQPRVEKLRKSMRRARRWAWLQNT